MINNTIKVFVERNMGKGYGKSYPRLPSFLYHFFLCIIGKPSPKLHPILCRFIVWVIGKPSQPLYKKFGFLIYHRCEIDKDCKDPRSKDRSPQINMDAIFPWRFNSKLLISKKGNDLLRSCWQAALETTRDGVSPKLEIELPSEWYIKNQ